MLPWRNIFPEFRKTNGFTNFTQLYSFDGGLSCVVGVYKDYVVVIQGPMNIPKWKILAALIVEDEKDREELVVATILLVDKLVSVPFSYESIEKDVDEMWVKMVKDKKITAY